MQPTRLPISPSTEFRYSSTIRTIANTAMLVSIVIYLYNFLITLFQSTTTNVFYTLFMGLIVTFGIVMCVLVIYGGKAKKPWAFLPYLFMTGIGITFILLLSLVLFTHGLFQQEHLAFKNLEDGVSGLELFRNKDEGKVVEYTARIACMSITISLFCMSVGGLIMSSLIPIGFWIIVFQTYRYVKIVARLNPPPSYDAIEIVSKEVTW